MNGHILTILPVVPVRSEPADASEMVTQQLFGEVAEVLDRKGDNWIRIRNVEDGYEGWADPKQFQALDASDPILSVEPWWVFGKVEAAKALIAGRERPLDLTLGCRWPEAGDSPTGKIATGDFEAVISADKLCRYTEAGTADVLSIAMRFEGVPYLWGGRTAWGVDCSGLVQTAFRICGYQMPRDAWQQASVGETVTFGDHRPGDLAYFVNDKGKVIHVGFLLEGNEILHASGCVRRDFFTAEGIRHLNSNNLTHRLNIIKRINLKTEHHGH